METTQRQSYMGSLKDCTMKLILLVISIGVGIFCGINDSPSAMYVTVLLQGVSNIHDSFQYLSGYSRFITIKELLVIIAATISILFAIFHFSEWTFSTTKTAYIIVALCISLPVISVLSEIWRLLRNNNF